MLLKCAEIAPQKKVRHGSIIMPHNRQHHCTVSVSFETSCNVPEVATMLRL